jgi:hypothetical protein
LTASIGILIDWDKNQVLVKFHRPAGPLACPARFERATYALEEFVAVQKSIHFNGL